MTICGVIPKPPSTRFLREAQHRDSATIGGVAMVVNQGIISIAYLAGIRPDPDAMRDALTKALQR